MSRKYLIIPIDDQRSDGDGVAIGVAIGLLVIVPILLLLCVSVCVPWILNSLCSLLYIPDLVSWGREAFLIALGVLSIVQIMIAIGAKDMGAIPGSALALDVVITVLVTVIFFIFGDIADGWVNYVLGIPVFALVFAITLYPLFSFVTTLTALPAVVVNWRYALGSLLGFVGMVSLVLACHALGEMICGLLSQELLEMVQIRFTGEYFMWDLRENVDAMRLGKYLESLLTSMKAGTRFWVFGTIAGVSIAERIAAIQKYYTI